MESEWAMFHTPIINLTAQSCATHGSNPRKRWWTPEVKGAVKLKKEIYMARLAFGIPEAPDLYPVSGA